MRRHIFAAGATLAMGMLAGAAAAAGQEPTAALSGRVGGADGRGIAGVIVTAQSAALVQHLETSTTTHGDYVLPSLPAGVYVVGFAREGLVPVKRTLRLSAGESAVAHVLMRPDEGDEGVITVVHEQLAFPPRHSTVLDSRTDLPQLPVTGSLRSVVGLAEAATTPTASERTFLFDGLPLRHGWRAGAAEAFAGPGPAAIRELTVVPGQLPAGYAELGATSLVTSSGGRRISGSIRTDIASVGTAADLLRTSRGLTGPTATWEYTLGGPIRAGSTWFFASGRHAGESVEDDTAVSDVPFETDVRDRFGLIRVTHALANAHHLDAQWLGARQRREDAPPVDAARVADLRALESRTLGDRAVSAGYRGMLGRAVQVTARYTREDGRSEVSAQSADGSSLVGATRLIDQATGMSAWASGGCPACAPARVTHHTLRGTASTLWSGRSGSHHVTAGVEVGRDAIRPSARPAGGRFELYATRLEHDGELVRPVFVPGGSSWIAWSPEIDSRLRVQRDAFFVSDRWAASPLLTLDLGLRLDRHRGVFRADGAPFLSERGLSPRVSATWRPSARESWTINGGFGRYAIGALDRIEDEAVGGAPAERVFVYDGPLINAAGTGLSTPAAIASVLDWFEGNGGTSRPAVFARDPGISTVARESIGAPHVDEWTFGVSRLLGEDGYARADVTWLTYGGLTSRRARPDEPPALDRFGLPIDVADRVVDDALEQRYRAFSLTAHYRFGHLADVGARYTLSSLRGNTDEAGVAGGPAAAGVAAYPEFFEDEWHRPVGALAGDARHRSRVWVHSELLANEEQGTLMLSFLVRTESGRPYGASGLVGVAPFVQAPGYQQPPVAARYLFTPRDELRTPSMFRADVGLSYTRRLPGSVHGELFTRFAVLNLVGKRRILDPGRLIVTRTAFTDPTLQPFDPFTETPVRDVHWTFDDANVRRDTARESLPTTIGRAVRLTLGVRF